jgi:hypothetical protein
MRTELSRALAVQWVAALARAGLGSAIVFGHHLDRVTWEDWAAVDAVTAVLFAWGVVRFARASSVPRRGALFAVTCLLASAICEVASACGSGDAAVCYVANLSGLVGLAIDARVIRAELLASCPEKCDELPGAMSWVFGAAAAMFALSIASEVWLLLAVLTYVLGFAVYVMMLVLTGVTLSQAAPRLPRAVAAS